MGWLSGNLVDMLIHLIRIFRAPCMLNQIQNALAQQMVLTILLATQASVLMLLVAQASM